jgi:hypothetical protein
MGLKQGGRGELLILGIGQSLFRTKGIVVRGCVYENDRKCCLFVHRGENKGGRGGVL